MEGTERDAFLGVFYDHYVGWLADPIVKLSEADSTLAASAAAAAATASVGAMSNARKASFGHVSDILSYCVRSHTYRMKYFVLRNNLVGRVLTLIQQRDKFLKLAAIRFVRACIGSKDDFYFRYLTKGNHLAPIFQLFSDNEGRDNLVNSAVVDLVDFIRTENIKR